MAVRNIWKRLSKQVGPSQIHELVSAASERRLKTLTFASWNQIHGWLRRLEGLRGAA
jgi:hypothetical protein